MERRVFLKSLLLALPSFFLFRWFNDIFNTSKHHIMLKSILNKSDLQFKQAFPGLKGVDIMAHAYPIEPVLVFTEYHMDKPVFGPHPHAGVSVMTYMLPDSKQGFINRDSLGDFSYIEPGGVHVSQAGSGMFHDEFPKETGVDTHGFQIWINHKESNRNVTPKAFHVNANEIKEVETTDHKVRIIHGAYSGKFASFELVTKINIFHVYLHSNKSIVFDAEEMAFVYGLNGVAKIEQTEVKAQTLVNFKKEGNKVAINAAVEGFEFMYCTAKPINEPIIYGGPFVMTTQEQMQITKHRYANGEMGDLKPYRP
jgi:redox-sensitive bicupin YhaK (pirin superfamily)